MPTQRVAMHNKQKDSRPVGQNASMTQTKEGEAAYLGNVLLFTLFTFFVTILMNIKKRLDE